MAGTIVQQSPKERKSGRGCVRIHFPLAIACRYFAWIICRAGQTLLLAGIGGDAR